MATGNPSKNAQNSDDFDESIFEVPVAVQEKGDSSSLSESMPLETKSNPDSESEISDNNLPGQETRATVEDVYKQHISFKDMVKHIIQLKVPVSLILCAAIVSGINDEEKTKALLYFLNYAFKTTSTEQQLMPRNSCLTCHRALIMATYPFDEIYWQNLNFEYDDIAACIVSYYANLCKIRNQSPKTDYHRLLGFLSTSDDISDKDLQELDKELYEQLQEVYGEFQRIWNTRLPKDCKLTRMIATGFGLVVVFDFSNHIAAQDILPFINHYCKHAVNIACYNSTRDEEELLKGLRDETIRHNYGSKSSELLKQICGVKGKRFVVLTETNLQTDIPHNTEIVRALQEATKIDQVDKMQVSSQTIASTKENLEKDVLNSVEFYEYVRISFFLLLSCVKRKCDSFWTKRRFIETQSKHYDFEKGDMDVFLRTFTSCGRILYFDDISSLQEYVIINIEQFVDKIHTLYQSHGPLRAYGIFTESNEKDNQMIFKFLTALGKAAKIKSNKIVQPFSLATTHFFIPTARSDWCQTAHNALELFSVVGVTKENLLACLCTRLLRNKNCLLIPTKFINTLGIRFISSEQKIEDIEFLDINNKIMVRSINEDRITEQQRDRISATILQNCPHFEKNIRMERQALIDAIHTDEAEFDAERILEIATTLTQCSSQLKTQVAIKLGKDEEWLQQKTEEKGEYKAMLIMLLNFTQNNLFTQLNSILEEFNIDF